MTLRPFVVALTALILAGVNGYLLNSEYNWHEEYHGIAPAEFKARHVTRKEDPLLQLNPLSSDREKNLKAMGLTSGMIKKSLDRMRDIDDRWKERLQFLMENVEQPTELADALCGQTQQVRPRYGAMRFFVEEEQGERRPVKLDRISGLERQKWSRTARIDEVYTFAELGEEVHEDATLMSIAAILLQKEDELLNGRKPWGRGLAATWSWSAVTKQYPQAEERMVEYFSIMHVAWELAASSDGICGE